ncbi:coiled-coil domain-containing protein 1-like [Macrobrachium nipponense]|uniref:coiled-coil domain-containing protein 1-like n=1 Tax=Macrobrachium nipponense TaxID=159736 RepID=UPI0030C84DE6
MPGKDSDKGDVPDGNGTSDIQHAKDNEGNAEPPSDENNTGNDIEESSILEKDKMDNICEVVEQLLTFPLSQSVDNVTGNPEEIEDKSQDLDCNVTTNNDDIKDTDSDSDIFAIKSAPEGASQVMEITDDEGPRSQDEPRVPYTIGSLSPVDDDKNEELDSLEEIIVAASAYRNDESVDDMPEECDMDLEVNKESDIEDDLENDDKGSNMKVS